MRRQHWLRGNKSCESPHLFCCVDTESRQRQVAANEVEHDLWFGWSVIQRARKSGQWCEPEWFRFQRSAVFWDHIEAACRAKTRLYLFAHSWDFDLLTLDAHVELRKRGWEVSNVVLESPPIIMRWRKGSLTILMLDSLNWWRMPLAVAGDAVGLPKLPMPTQRAGRQAWDTYCRRDVEVLFRLFHSWWTFLRDYDLGGFAPTLASQSFRSFTHRFMKHRILIDSHPKALTLARAALHGGRTEAFRIGRVEGPITVLDVNSMYPYVMRRSLFPTVLKTYIVSVTHEQLARWAEKYCLVARVTLRTQRPRFAHVYNDRLVFPVGRFEEVLTTPDIRDALAHDEIKRVHDVAVYDAQPIFESFVDELYGHRVKAKRRGDHVSTWLLKIMLNALWGKFAQRGEVWQNIGRRDNLDFGRWLEVNADTGKVRSLRCVCGLLQERGTSVESYNSHPALSAHVTAYARQMLWSLFSRAGFSHVIYCDTDSIWVDDVGASRLNDLVSEDALGGLKREAVHNWVTIHTAKDYQTPDGGKTKGVRKSAEWITTDIVVQEQWSRLPGLLATGQWRRPRVRRITKHLKRDYLKGNVGRDGVVTPFHLTS